MKSLSHLAKAATLACASLVLDALTPSSARGADIMLNGSFETGNWDGSRSFVDPTNGTTLQFWNTLVSKWTPNTGSTWIQDPVRASDGNRMVWLGPPSSGTETYISQPISTLAAGGALLSNTTYHLELDYDFFDPTDPTGTMPMLSTIQVYYKLGSYMDMGDPNAPMLMDGFVQTLLFTDTGMTDSWANGASMNWQTMSLDFTTPNMLGYDYLRLFIVAPQDTVGTPSMGVLVDRVSLVPVPEPGSLIMLGLLGSAVALRRRRSPC